MKRYSKDEVLKLYARGKHRKSPSDLRYEAHLAHLDGRAKDAKEYNRRADILDRFLNVPNKPAIIQSWWQESV